ncbi:MULTISPECIES: hypothetical protein [Flammeovirga]|uniref:Uncharacterized protein n=1 Tax=Flammeovirga agarivorans TaxID=2726742 RepID=A0A7X8SHQ4_9BACT|nr:MULTISPECIES: hypothetical protein [Flammeovirga]NLR90352.1 hypothetical protein [Flammeovirga agarivorans]
MSQVNTDILSTQLDFKWSLKFKSGLVHAATFAFRVLSNDPLVSRVKTEKIHRELLTNSTFRRTFGIEDVNHDELVVYSTNISSSTQELDRKMHQFQRWVRQAQRDANIIIEKFSPTI